MAGNQNSGRKRVKNKYKGVSYKLNCGKYVYYYMTFCNGIEKIKSTHRTERGAAIAYDIQCIKHGKPPVNILKPKQ